MSNLATRLARPELLELAPYAAGSAERDLVRLHTNEAPYSLSPERLNWYPEPQPPDLVQRLASIYRVPASHLLLTRGSDDGIDLLVRCFCRAGVDRVVVCPPTFAMYAQSARLQNAAVVEVPLRAEQGFAVDTPQLVAACDGPTRLVFLCSPNNPTGNLPGRDTVRKICQACSDSALVVLDEAYIEFARQPSLASLVTQIPNLVVLRTLSKAFGLAGIRVGAMLAAPGVIDIVRRALPPYPLPTPSIQAAFNATSTASTATLSERIRQLRQLRESLRLQLQALPAVRRCWASQTNFLLVEVNDVAATMSCARAAGILIRDVSAHFGLSNCVRITVGSDQHNRQLLAALETLR